MFVGRVSEAPEWCFTWVGWKGLPGTNALVYYENSYITEEKSFITLCPGERIMAKKFCNIGSSSDMIRSINGQFENKKWRLDCESFETKNGRDYRREPIAQKKK